jgi:chromosome segregation ATPase
VGGPWRLNERNKECFNTVSTNPQQPYTVGSDSGSGIKIPILFGLVLALIAGNVYLFLQIDGLKKDLAKTQEMLLDEVGRVKETSTVTTAAARRNIETLKTELDEARRQAAAAVGQAKVDATKHADEVARRLEQQQRAADQAVRSEISKVDEKANTANTQVGEVSKEVSSVKSDLSSTKSELDKTIATLSSTRGDMGVQSGLIATNSKELAALKALGERNYFEFTLGKTKAPQRVGDILVQLKKVDVKRNRYTIEIVADDKKTEKKDKTVNEPVQFYTSKARQPYEMVVNEVRKDTIVGYLATPKVTIAR